MATIAQLNQDDEDQQNAGPTPVSGTAGASDSSGTGQGGAATVSPVKQNQAPQANQGYTDVASYLNANQQGSAQLGQQVASNLTNKYTNTKQGINDSYGQFAGDVNKGYTQENTDLINQVAANPMGAANDPNQLASYQAQLNNQYSGPQNWADYGTQQGKVNDANSYASLANTPGGLNVYAQDVEGANGGPQSQGINQLDTLLLGGSADAMNQVQGAASQYKDLNDYINAQNTAGKGLVTGAQTAAQTGSQHALDAFTGANGTLTGLNSTINTNAANQLSGAQSQQAQLAANLGMVYNPGSTSAMTGQAAEAGQAGKQNSGYLESDVPVNYSINQNAMSDANLQSLGLSRDQWNTLQGALGQAGTSQMMTGHNFGQLSKTNKLDLGAGLTQGDPTQRYTAATTATADQYKQMAAIQQLLGSKNPTGNAINPLNANQAGTANMDGLNQFDYEGALQAANTAASGNRAEAQDIASYLTNAANAKHEAGKGGFMKGVTNAAKVINPVSYLANTQALNYGKKGLDKLKGA